MNTLTFARFRTGLKFVSDRETPKVFTKVEPVTIDGKLINARGIDDTEQTFFLNEEPVMPYHEALLDDEVPA